ncbi:MAG: MarC family protein [Puniceicoccales bacterium]|jgi:multiple antibiotic resistance protein|nr:MarC family protein [Puniceicoccales bacterium]
MGVCTQGAAVGACGCLWEMFGLLWDAANPFAVAVLFFAMCSRHSEKQRRAMIRTASFIAFSMLLVFAFFGQPIIAVLETGMPSLRVACGVLLAIIGLGMLRSDDPPDSKKDPETFTFDRFRPNWSIMPLAVPLMAGPDSLTAAMNCRAAGCDGCLCISIIGSIALLVIGMALLLLAAAYLVRFCGKTLPKLFFRIAGLVILSIALQMMLVGFTGIEPFSSIIGS